MSIQPAVIADLVVELHTADYIRPASVAVAEGRFHSVVCIADIPVLHIRFTVPDTAFADHTDCLAEHTDH